MEVACEEQPLETEIIDYSKIPICIALSTSTKVVLSNFLNTPRCLPTEDGLPKDWRGLAHLVGLNNGDISVTEKDPTSKVFDLWVEKSKETCYVQVLINFLRQLDRWDIVDDTKDIIDTDIKKYLNLKNESSETAQRVDVKLDNEILTRHDVNRISNGFTPQYYDAYVLFADADIAFATKMMEKLERVYNLKLCTKNRDLIGGHIFEHSAIMKLISERCNRLVIVVTQAFLESDYLKFFYNFAQALAIDQQSRKVVPLRLDASKWPLEFCFFSVVDYTSCLTYNNFWDNLYRSIKPITANVIMRRESHAAADTALSSMNKSVIPRRPKSTSYYTENDLERESTNDGGVVNLVESANDFKETAQRVQFNDNTTVPLNGCSNETTPPQKQVKSKLDWLKKFIHKKDTTSNGRKKDKDVCKKSRQKVAV